MAYPAVGFLVTIGVLIGTAIYYFVRNNAQNQPYGYNSEPFVVPPKRPIRTTRSEPRQRRRRSPTADKECTICLEVMDGQHTTTLKCGHFFHYECIGNWFKLNKNCPLCRDT